MTEPKEYLDVRESLYELLREADKFDHLIFCCDCEDCVKQQQIILDQILAIKGLAIVDDDDLRSYTRDDPGWFKAGTYKRVIWEGGE